MSDQTITQITSRSKFLTVTTVSTIGILVLLNVILRFPDLGTLIAQYNQF